MTPTPDDPTLAVVVSRLDDLRSSVGELRGELRSATAQTVSRGEWGQRNDHVDTRLNGLGREVGDLRAEVRAKHAPWWSIAAIVAAGASLAWQVVGPAVTGTG